MMLSTSLAYLLYFMLPGICLALENVDNAPTKNAKQPADDAELKTVVVIYRHGDRTPVDPYPNDPYRNKSYWPVDFGQLTNLGKRQHYEFGKWLRRRYDGFLPARYSEQDVHVRATDVDRTLMSAQANLAGLYPPVTRDDTWNAELAWQPIPVHTTPEADDVVLAMKTNCPRYNHLMALLMEEPYFKALAAQNRPLYEYVTRQTGRRVADVQSLEYIYNTLYIEQLYNYTLPAWTRDVYPAAMRPLAGLSFAIPCYNRELARLKVGPLMEEVWRRLSAVTRDAHDAEARRRRAPFIESAASLDAPKKLWMYSAHDTTVANVLSALRVFEPHAPPYASAVLLEVRGGGGGDARDHYVNVYYKNTSVATPVTLPGCAFDCRLEDVRAALAPIMVAPADWYVECERRSLGGLLSFESVEGVVFFALCALVLTIVAMLLACVLCAKPKCEQRTYLRLPDDDENV